MKTLTKFRLAVGLIALAASSALSGQTGESVPGKAQGGPSIPNARQIVEPSIAAMERSWEARDHHYTYMERDEDRRLDARGELKSEDIDITKMILVNGARFEQLMEHNGQPPTAEQGRKRDEDLERMKHESPEDRSARLLKEQENRSFLRDLTEAFDFQLIGEETVDGRPAYVLQATPHPGYHAHGKYGKIFANVEGKLWVDKQDLGWVKVDGQVTNSFSMGYIVARVQRGSHIILEQTCVGDGIWVPKRVQVRASARILLFKSFEMNRILTYSDYLSDAGGSYTVSR